MPRQILRRTALFIAIAALSTASSAQKTSKKSTPEAPWPTKTVKLMVGFPAGSSPDLVARAMAEPLSKAIGQPVIVENHPGAGGNIAADLVAKSSDNHTLGIMINGNMTIAKLLNPKTPFDPAKDLAPISLIGTAPLVLAAPANTPGIAPGANAQEFLVAARNAGNKWNYGTPGNGTVAHIGMEYLKVRTQMDAVHIPYQGNPQVITAMLGGQINLSLLPPGLAMPQIRAGKLKAIGVTSVSRSPLVPELPSLTEAGVQNFQLEIWTAAAGPATLPAPVVAKLSALFSEIARSPEMRQKLFTQGWQVAGTSAEGLANRIKSDTRLLGGVIEMRGIKVE